MTERTDITAKIPDPTEPISDLTPQERRRHEALLLGTYLTGRTLDAIIIKSFMLTATTEVAYVVRLESTEEGEDGPETVFHEVDSGAVNLLQNIMDILPRSQRRLHRTVIKNLRLIQDEAHDPDNWPTPSSAIPN